MGKLRGGLKHFGFRFRGLPSVCCSKASAAFWSSWRKATGIDIYLQEQGF